MKIWGKCIRREVEEFWLDEIVIEYDLCQLWYFDSFKKLLEKTIYFYIIISRNLIQDNPLQTAKRPIFLDCLNQFDHLSASSFTILNSSLHGLLDYEEGQSNVKEGLSLYS